MLGVTRVGLVAKTSEPEPVSSLITPANSAEVVAACTDNLSLVYTTVPPVPKATELASVPVKVKVLLAVKVLPSAIVKVEPVAGVVIATLLILVAVATPNVGVTSVGLLAKTKAPEPVSSLITPASSAEVVVANTLNLLFVRAIVPLEAGSVITVPVPAAAVGIICAVPLVDPGNVILVIPVKAKLALARLRATAVVPI